MIGKAVKPIGIVLAGILCIYLDGFAAEKDAKKSSEPAKKAAKAASKKEAAAPKKKRRRLNRRTIQRRLWRL